MGGAFADAQILLSFLNLAVFYGCLVWILWKIQKVARDISDVKRSVGDLQELIMQLPRPEVPTRAE
jgi:hypothetical protein